MGIRPLSGLTAHEQKPVDGLFRETPAPLPNPGESALEPADYVEAAFAVSRQSRRFPLLHVHASFSALQRDALLSKQKSFEHIALISKPDGTPRLVETLTRALKFLRQRKITTSLSQQSAALLGKKDGLPLDTLGDRCDLAIVIGGDGTLLHSARELVDLDIPLLGVNLGRLGFLVDISPEHMCDMFEAVLNGEYQEDKRMLLHCSVGKQPPELALNDVVLHKWNIARMIEFETWVNESFIDTQRSDGLIISTPTGSTAYALSGGGPLLSPGLDVIALVPICPHTLSNRPIVVDGNREIRLRVCGKTDPEHVRVTCDGQSILGVTEGDDIVIRRHHRPLRLLHPAGHDHFQILRTKLAWGESPS